MNPTSPSTLKTPITRLIRLFGLLISTCLFSSAADIQKPNIIVIFTDDQGYQDLSCFGSPLIDTPNIDQMADEGVRLTNFHVSSSVCSASRASLLTGRKPSRHGVTGVYSPNSTGMNNSEVTIADVLKAAGYRTAMFGKWHLGDRNNSDLPLAFGFDEYFGIPYSNDMTIGSQQSFSPDCVFLEGYNLSQAQADQSNPIKNKVPLFEGNLIAEYPAAQASLTRRYFDRAIGTIDDATASNPENPFFIYIAPAMPHIPLFASPEFAGTSARGLYGDVVEEIDHHTGRLLDHLRGKGLDERTIVIFTSDNGPWVPFGNDAGDSDPYRGGKFSLNEGGTRVPCVAWWPAKWPAGRESIEKVSSVDLLPTFVHYAGASLPNDYLDGINISHHFENPSLPTGRKFDVTEFRRSNTTFQAVHDGPWKLMPDGESEGSTSSREPRLYHVSDDPDESDNLYASKPAKVQQLQALLNQFTNSLGNSADNTPPNAPTGLTATSAAPGAIALQWNDNSAADLSHYIVYRALSSGAGFRPIAVTTTSDLSDTHATGGGTMFYRIVAVDERGNFSTPSTESSALPVNTPPPSAMKLLEFDFSGLSGNQPDFVPGIITPGAELVIEANLSRNDLGISASNLSDDEWNLTTTLTDPTLDDVIAADDDLFLDFSIAPNAGKTVIVTELRYSFLREGADSPTDYHLFSSSNGFEATDAISSVSVSNTETTVFTADNLWIKIGTPEEFRLILSGNGPADASTHITGVSVHGFLTDIPPGPPTGLNTTIPSRGIIELNWSPPTDSDLATAPYTIYRSENSGSGFSMIATDVAGTSYVDSTVGEGSTVHYVVTATDLGGNESSFSNQVSVTLPDDGVIELTGNTTGAAGGGFADYGSLSGGAWDDSSNNDGVVALSVSRTSFGGETSITAWNPNGYLGPGTGISFTKGSATTAAGALSSGAFIVIKTDSSAFGATEYLLESVTLQLWRNGSQAATFYQFAYDQENDGYTQSDLIATPTEINSSGTSNSFQISASLPPTESTQHEVRLYFWNPSGGAANANTHLFDISASYTLAEPPRVPKIIGISISDTEITLTWTGEPDGSFDILGSVDLAAFPILAAEGLRPTTMPFSHTFPLPEVMRSAGRGFFVVAEH